MTDYLIATLDAGGNVPPALGIGAELAARGHRVRVLSHEAQRAAVTDAGLPFDAYRNSPPWTPHAEMSTLTGAARMAAMMTSSGIADDVVAAVTEHDPDIVIVDCMLLGVLNRLQREQVPPVTLFHTLYGWFDSGFRYGPIGLAGRLLRLGDPRDLWDRSRLQLLCTDHELDRRSPRGRFEQIGPVHGVTEAAEPADPPRVLVSLSTNNYPGLRQTLQKLLDACAGVAAEFVVTSGPAVDPTTLRAPTNATLHRYVPHGELMPACTAVVCHGGHATTMRALAHGLPTLIVPMHPLLDQPSVGKAVTAAGAGATISRRASTGTIRDAIADLIATASYRSGAAAIGQRFRAADGATVGADRLEQLTAARTV